MDPQSRLGEILVRTGVVAPEQLEQAHQEQSRWGGRLAHLVVEMGFLHEERLVQLLSQQLGLPIATLDGIRQISPEALEQLPASTCERYDVLPVGFDPHKGRLQIAISDPTDRSILQEIRTITGKEVDPYIAGSASIRRAIRIYYYGESSVEAMQVIPDLYPDSEVRGGREEGKNRSTTPLPPRSSSPYQAHNTPGGGLARGGAYAGAQLGRGTRPPGKDTGNYQNVRRWAGGGAEPGARPPGIEGPRAAGKEGSRPPGAESPRPPGAESPRPPGAEASRPPGIESGNYAPLHPQKSGNYPLAQRRGTPYPPRSTPAKPDPGYRPATRRPPGIFPGDPFPASDLPSDGEGLAFESEEHLAYSPPPSPRRPKGRTSSSPPSPSSPPPEASFPRGRPVAPYKTTTPPPLSEDPHIHRRLEEQQHQLEDLHQLLQTLESENRLLQEQLQELHARQEEFLAHQEEERRQWEQMQSHTERLEVELSPLPSHLERLEREFQEECNAQQPLRDRLKEQRLLLRGLIDLLVERGYLTKDDIVQMLQRIPQS